jgi:ABC-type polysaccharide/polyol phosphate transport system ATPase subunit
VSRLAVDFLDVSKSFVYYKEKADNLKGLLSRFTRERSVATSIQVLRNISFTLEKGEFVGIMGRNGTGKSTILKLIAGIYSPNQGKIRTEGVIAPLIELGAGFAGDLSGYENIFLNASILGFKKKDVEEALDEIIEFSELGEKIHMPVKNYSSGMLVRLGFAIATHLPASIMLIDEVLAVGDVGFQRKCLRKIDQLHKQGRTIVLVTHNPQDIQKYCQRCIVIESTGKAYDGPALRGSEIYDHFSKTWGWLHPDIRKLIESGVPFDSAIQKANLNSNQKLRELVHPVEDLQGLGVAEQVFNKTTKEFLSWQKAAKLDFSSAPFCHKTSVEHFFCDKLISEYKFSGRGLYLAHGSAEFKEAQEALSPEIQMDVFNPFDPEHVLRPQQSHETVGLRDWPGYENGADFIVIQHAFKHFKGDLDSAMIRDIATTLKPGGTCVILPVYIGDKAIEAWNAKPNCETQIGFISCVSADNVFAGSEVEGHFARIYDAKTFQERVLKVAEGHGLQAQLLKCRLDDQDQPDQKMNYSFYLDRPMRALVLSRSLLRKGE